MWGLGHCTRIVLYLTFNSVDFGATISVTSFCAPFLARKEDLEHLFANAKARVCVQLPTSADNVALPAFVAAGRAVARLLLSTGRAAINRYLLASGPTAANPLQRRGVAGRDGTDTRTDGRTHDSCIDPAPHTMCVYMGCV